LWTTLKGMLPVKHKAARVFDVVNVNGKQVALLSVPKRTGAFIEKAILVGETQDSIAIDTSLAVPVRFGHAANDPVDVVLAFASPDHDAHAGMLSALAHRLADGLGDKLRAATSNGDAVAVLNEVIEDVRTPVR